MSVVSLNSRSDVVSRDGIATNERQAVSYLGRKVESLQQLKHLQEENSRVLDSRKQHFIIGVASLIMALAVAFFFIGGAFAPLVGIVSLIVLGAGAVATLSCAIHSHFQSQKIKQEMRGLEQEMVQSNS